MIDKFLTDLAAHAGADAANVDYRAYWGDPNKRFEVGLWHNSPVCALDIGTGPTVEAAMNAAIAAKRAREAELAA